MTRRRLFLGRGRTALHIFADARALIDGLVTAYSPNPYYETDLNDIRITSSRACSFNTQRRAKQDPVMTLSSSDFADLAFLELIEEGVEPPDGLDIDKLAHNGLVAQQSCRWTLTRRGLLRLQNLQSLARSLAQASFRSR